MSIGPVDIEFVIKGDVEAKLKQVSGTVKGESGAVNRHMQDLTKSAQEAFGLLSRTTQVQAETMQRVVLAIEANASAMEKVKNKYAEGSISVKQYTEAMARLTTEKQTLQQQQAMLAKDIQQEIQNNNLVSGSISELQHKLTALKDSYNNLSAEERQSEFGANMLNQIKELSVEIDKAEVGNRSFIDIVRSMPGPLGAAATGIQGMTKAAMRFIATPIGIVLAAITAAIMTLTSWFRRTEEGQNALVKSSAIFKQTLDSLLDVVDKVGAYLFKAFTRPKDALRDLVDYMKGQVIFRFQAIGKMAGAIGKMFSGDWKSAFDEMENAVGQFMTGVDDFGKKNAKNIADFNNKIQQRVQIEDKLFKLRVEERKVQEDIEASRGRIAELRYKARDDSNNLSDKERLAHLTEAGDLIEENFRKEIDIATRRRDLVKQQKSLSNSNIEDNEEVSKLNIEISRLKARQADEQRELLRQSNTLGQALANAAITGTQAMQQEIEKLNKELLDAGDAQRADIAARIVELQKELYVRLQIAEAALLAARNAAGGSDQVPSQVEPVKTRAQEIFAATVKEIKGATLETEKLNQKIKEGEHRAKALQKAWNDENFQKFVDGTQEVIDMTRSIAANHREILGLNDEQAHVVDKSLQMISGMGDLAAGDILGGVYKLVDSALSLFKHVPETMNVHFEQLRDNIAATMNQLDRAFGILQSVGSENINLVFLRLRTSLKELVTEAENLNKATANVTFGSWLDFGNLFGQDGIAENIAKMRADIDELVQKLAFGNLNNAQRASINAVLDSYKEIIQTIDTITQDVIGTTARSLGMGLTEAFLAGEDAALHWGESVSNIVQRVIVKQLSAQLLETPLQKAIDNLIAGMQDGLEPWEAGVHTQAFKRIFEEAKPAMEAMKQQLESVGIIFGDQKDQEVNGMSGAIRAITEESANIIAGQLMGLRVDIKGMLVAQARASEIADQSLAYQAEIALNTRHNYKLNDIDLKLGEMNRYLKSIF